MNVNFPLHLYIKRHPVFSRIGRIYDSPCLVSMTKWSHLFPSKLFVIFQLTHLWYYWWWRWLPFAWLTFLIANQWYTNGAMGNDPQISQATIRGSEIESRWWQKQHHQRLATTEAENKIKKGRKSSSSENDDRETFHIEKVFLMNIFVRVSLYHSLGTSVYICIHLYTFSYIFLKFFITFIQKFAM